MPHCVTGKVGEDQGQLRTELLSEGLTRRRGRCSMKWERFVTRGLFRGHRSLSIGCVIVCILIIAAFYAERAKAAESDASGGIAALAKVSPEDVVAELATGRGVYSHLLMLPIGQNVGVLREEGKGRRAFRLVRPGKAPVELWSGEIYRASLLCATDGSGFILAEDEYDKDTRKKKTSLVKVYDPSGKEVASYAPPTACFPVAALSAGRALFVERNDDGTDVFSLYDQSGQPVGKAGPFKVKDRALTHDGNRMLVNVGEERGGIDGLRGWRGASTKILIVDMAKGSVLYELPPAFRGQLSPDGRFVVTADKGKLRFWKDGKEVKVFDLKTPATLAVFSPDGRYCAFGVGRAVHVYRTDDWTRTMAVEPSEPGQSFGIDTASLSNSGRLMVSSDIPEQSERNQSNLLCLYDSDGVRLWLGRYPWQDGRPTVPAISALTPDGHEAYVRLGDKLVRVTVTSK